MLQVGTYTATVLPVLVVDDNAVLRDLVHVAVEDAGLTVVGEATDGAHALTQAATRGPPRGAVDRGHEAQLARAIRRSEGTHRHR